MRAEERTSSVEGSAGDARDVLGLLRRQADLSRRLQTLADRQRRAVRAEETGPLLGLLADRQKLTDELVAVRGRLQQARKSWEEVRHQLSGEELQEADALVQDSERRLNEILAGDEADARMLAARKRRTEETVSSTRAGGRMLAAYGRQGTPGATQIDRTDEEG